MTAVTDESTDDLKKRFDDDHQHPVNRALHMIGVPIIAVSVPTFFFSVKAGAGLLVLGYGLNFLGHAIEGRAPSLFRDPRNIVLGAKHFGSEVLSLLRRRG